MVRYNFLKVTAELLAGWSHIKPVRIWPELKKLRDYQWSDFNTFMKLIEQATQSYEPPTLAFEAELFI